MKDKIFKHLDCVKRPLKLKVEGRDSPEFSATYDLIIYWHRKKVMSRSLCGPLGRAQYTVNQFQQHQATRSIATPPWMG